MNRVLAFLVSIVTALGLAGCAAGGGDTDGATSTTSGRDGGGASSSSPLVIAAATELKDLEPLVARASNELGFSIEMTYPGGTLENSQKLKDGQFNGGVDATWFATNRYVDLIGGGDQLESATSIASSPVAFGLWTESAQRLGWDKKQPTWADFAAASASGEFTFGMTDPTSSNSGFSALVSVATALADTGLSLTPQDIEAHYDDLTSLFKGQTITSGSSGWLADTFAQEPGKVDGIVNYEANLQQLRDAGLPITVIVPADGAISADYPLAALTNPAHPGSKEKVDKLSEFLLDHQEDLAASFRRPVDPAVPMREELTSQTVFELPFPQEYSTVQQLVTAYHNEYRTPGSTAYVLDTSGSMQGDRMRSLKSIMNKLIDGSAQTLTGNVAFRDNEEVTLNEFSTEPGHTMTVTYNRSDEAAKQQLTDFVNGLIPFGNTALYSAVYQALQQSGESENISTIVLMTDGMQTSGMTYSDFEAAYAALAEQARSVPVFVILYGEASEEEMTKLSRLTGGKVFDAVNGDLEQAFKEIRGFQ